MSEPQFGLGNENTDDLVSKIVVASTLENEGKIAQAVAIYQEISREDPSGNYGNVAREALKNLEQSSEEDTSVSEVLQAKEFNISWRDFSFRLKVPLVAIILAILPVLAVGSTAYYITNKNIKQTITAQNKTLVLDLRDKVNQFMKSRFQDLQMMATLDIFTNSLISENIAEKTATLERIKSAYGVYESIAIFDLQGNPIAQTQAGKKLGNHLDRIYIQDALEANGAVISQPLVSSTSGTVSIYSASTIKDKTTGKAIGFIRARIPVKHIAETLTNYTVNEQKYYLVNNTGEIFLDSSGKASTKISSSGKSLIDKQSSLPTIQSLFANVEPLSKSKTLGATVTTNLNSGDRELIAYAPPNQGKEIFNLDWNYILATDVETAFAQQQKLALTLILSTLSIVVVVAAIASILASKLTRPIIQAAEVVDELGRGNFEARIPISGTDEIAKLGMNINRMAGQIEDLLHIQEAEAKSQRQEKEKLQHGVMGLLLDVEGAKRGDLTVRAEMTDGAVGSIADAFNSTLGKLQALLQEVQNVSGEVGQLSLAGEDSVKLLSESALAQAAEIERALIGIDEINRSVKTIADYAQEAAEIARHGSIQAKEGDLAMDATVNSIENIRATVANTAKKVKQLAESSQEIAQIVEIISGISERTNLLAFNASVEAARAGEHGEGFRVVAEEVRRLADRITEATKDIQQLVTAIQQDTGSVLEGMETSTSEVVNGSELIRMTKLNLQTLAQTSQQIDEYLKSISRNTIEQTDNSKEVNEKINGIALVAKTTSNEAQSVVQSLQTLVKEAENLQASVSQFKLSS